MNDRPSVEQVATDLWSQLESLFDVVYDCERQWCLDDRFDLILGVQPRGAKR